MSLTLTMALQPYACVVIVIGIALAMARAQLQAIERRRQWSSAVVTLEEQHECEPLAARDRRHGVEPGHPPRRQRKEGDITVFQSHREEHVLFCAHDSVCQM